MSDRQMENHIDIKASTIHLFGEVDENMYGKLVMGFSLIEGPLIIQLSTEGGDFYYALAMYDLIRERGNVIVECTGPLMSSGTIIAAAGKQVLATPNCQFMVHYGEDSNSNSSESQHNRKMLKLMQNIIAQRAKNVTKRTVNGWFKTETYFTAERALELGFIDGIRRHG